MVNRKSLERVLTLLLGVLLILSIFLTVYLIYVSKIGTRLTEFYILNSEYRAYDYPTEIYVNNSYVVIIGVRNYEYRPMKYKIWVFLSNKTYDYNYTIDVTPEDRWNGTLSYNSALTREIFLEHNETVLIPLNFTVDTPGRHRIVFLLTVNNSRKVYRSLHLWIDVSEPPEDLI